VIKRLRGTTAEQIAALPPDRPRKKAARAEQEEQPAPTKKPATRKEKLPPAPPPKPKPPPDRGKLDDAERALAEAKGRHRVESKVLAEEEAALVRRRPFRHPLLKLRAGIASALFYGAFRAAAVRIAAALPQAPPAHGRSPRHTHGASRNPRTLLVSDAYRLHLAAEQSEDLGQPHYHRETAVDGPERPPAANN
jgi:hypothetical protein